MAKMIGAGTYIKGKVGNFIYCTFKGIQVVKTMFVPENPHSESQTRQRTKFAILVKLGKKIVMDVIRPVWNQIAPSGSTGWAEFLKQNLLLQTEQDFDFSKLLFSKGTLNTLRVTGSQYDSLTGITVFNWDASNPIGHQANDSINIIVINKDATKVAVFLKASYFDEQTAQVKFERGLELSDVVIFGYVSRVEGENILFSDSVSSSPAAP
jgi:hypothetical protein